MEFYVYGDVAMAQPLWVHRVHLMDEWHQVAAYPQTKQVTDLVTLVWVNL